MARYHLPTCMVMHDHIGGNDSGANRELLHTGLCPPAHQLSPDPHKNTSGGIQSRSIWFMTNTDTDKHTKTQTKTQRKRKYLERTHQEKYSQVQSGL